MVGCLKDIIDMGFSTAIDAYITREPEWKRDILRVLREAIHKADPDIKEVVKWGAPTFEDHGIVAWMFCASNWVHFSFLQGALLDDSHGLFEERDGTTSKAKRTIKFREGQHIPVDIIVSLVKKAVANNRSGKKVDFKIAKPGTQQFDIPKEYEDFLKENKMFDEYKSRAFYQQRGWIEWIEAAQREETRQKRAQTMVRELQTGQYMPSKSDRK
jgi:hypothetical protein